MMNRPVHYHIFGLSLLLLFSGCIHSSDKDTEGITNYKPNQPIIFPHAPHAGIEGVDCKYCHNSALNSKEDKRPNADICLNCHNIGKELPDQDNKTRLDQITTIILNTKEK